jgi:hypothetical protein
MPITKTQLALRKIAEEDDDNQLLDDGRPVDDEDYDLDLVSSLNSAFIDDYDNNLLYDDVDLLIVRKRC